MQLQRFVLRFHFFLKRFLGICLIDRAAICRYLRTRTVARAGDLWRALSGIRGRRSPVFLTGTMSVKHTIVSQFKTYELFLRVPKKAYFYGTLSLARLVSVTFTCGVSRFIQIILCIEAASVYLICGLNGLEQQWTSYIATFLLNCL